MTSPEEISAFLELLGATEEDLADAGGDLSNLATLLAVRPGEPIHSLRDAAAAVGVPVQRVRELRRAAGLAALTSDDEVALSDRDLEMLRVMEAATELFEPEAVLQIVRVVGSGLARIAETISSAFLVNVGRGIPEDDQIAMSRANMDAAELLPAVNDVMDVLLRHHIVAARRAAADVDSTARYEVRTMTIGFIDLVGSTELASHRSLGEMGILLGRFEAIATDAVRDLGGRVVKLIGDEVMFASPEVDVARAVAREVVEAVRADPDLPAVRVGLATGEAMHREGDLFGPVVNRAARIVAAAEPGTILLDEASLLAEGETASSVGARDLRGFDEPVAVFELPA